jgi:very-short-patch-repair endonuclease
MNIVICDALLAALGVAAFERHRIRVGEPSAFQGDERDIMFISMVAVPQDKALSGRAYEKRFNVAASRAKDRMYLVRSVEADQLSEADQLRRSLIEHFASPFPADDPASGDRRARCESGFERELFDLLVARGYRVDTQVRAGTFRIDLVVDGLEDRRLAIECDGDRWHGPEQWPEDIARQRQIERAGWRVWRCFASTFVRKRNDVIADLEATLASAGIAPLGPGEGAPSHLTEHRRWRSDAAEQAPFAHGPIPMLSSGSELSAARRVDEGQITACIRHDERLQANALAVSASTSASRSSNQAPRSVTSMKRPASRSSKPSSIKSFNSASLRCSRSARFLSKASPAPTTALASTNSADATRSSTKRPRVSSTLILSSAKKYG